jgi:hypothetical protein
MTIEISQFECPTCGHPMGKEEYEHACKEFNKKVQARCDEQIQRLKDIHRREMYEQGEKHLQELERKVSEQTRSQLIEYEEKSKHEKAAIIVKFEQELRKKDEEVQTAKLHNCAATEEKIEEALKRNEEKYRQKEIEFQLQISRILTRNGELVEQAEKMQQTIENLPPEFKGTAGEMVLFDDLHLAFPQDHLAPKIIGVEMPDIIQTIRTENGEGIDTPILWDMKTGESITTVDMKKAKRYKEIYNTNYCDIVNSKSKSITTKDLKNCRAAGLIGKREGIFLVHQSIAVDVAEETRNFIIEKTRLLKNNNGRSSKEIKLYDYITSPERFRKIQKKMENRLKLEELIRKQEDYNKKAWNEQKNLIRESFTLDTDDQKTIDEITQQFSLKEEEVEDRDKKR